MPTPTCYKVPAYGATGSLLNGLSRIEVERCRPTGDEIQIEILYCGVCHSDLHQVRNDWKNTLYPCVPGHEIVGRVVSTGRGAKRFKPGDLVGVGCMIDSCGRCRSCRNGEENYCEGPVGWTATYNGYMNPKDQKFNTFGGYSTEIVVREPFVLSIPKGLPPAAAAPILCAGVTTYSPMKHWQVGRGSKVAIVGLGGLGHLAVKLAKALGAEVTGLTSTEAKRKAAMKLGARQIINTSRKHSLERHQAAFDLVLITIPEAFDLNEYVPLAKRNGAIVTVGLLGPFAKALNNEEIAFHRRKVSGSLIGSIAETQEVLDFCAQHRISPDIQLMPMEEINQAFDRLKDKEVRFRHVIDMASLKHETSSSTKQDNTTKRLAAL